MLRRNLLLPVVYLAVAAMSHEAFALTETVPAGVRAFVYKYMHGSVPGSFGETGVEEGLSVNATLGASILRNLSKDTEVAYNEIAAIDPQLAANLDLGRVDLDPKITAAVNGFALAWGLTDEIMIGGVAPFFMANVDVNGGFENTRSLNNTVNALKAYANNGSLTQKQRDSAGILAQVLAQLPTMQGEYLQGAVVNDYGYKPVGDWKGSGVGDLEFFTQWRFLERGPYAQAVKFGHSFPTGRSDDPDNLLDIPFGTGYYSTYAETLHDLMIIDKAKLMVSGSFRYYYNWAANRTYRLAPDSSFPLTSKKEEVRVKPGNAWMATAEIGSRIWYDLSWSGFYSMKTKYRDDAQGVDPSYNYGILTENSASRSHTLGGGISYSTVNNFKRKKFPIPLQVGVETSQVVKGLNTEKLKVYALNVKLFF